MHRVPGPVAEIVFAEHQLSADDLSRQLARCGP
jgi:hypothetical protein